MKLTRSFPAVLAVLTSFLLTACATTEEAASARQPDPAASQSTSSGPEMEVYEVHHDGRIHVFYDQGLYEDFLKMGETPYRLTRIGSGPHGESVVFGLTRKDKKMKQPIPVVDLFDGKTKAPEKFYGEMLREGRLYVFDDYGQMKTVRELGEPIYRYTMIGAGPNGETVVFVLTKANKKKRPDPLIARFEARHSSHQQDYK